MPYTTAEHVAKRLGLELTPDELILVNSLIERAESIVDGFTHRNFYNNSDEIEYFDGEDGLLYIYPENTPLLSVSEITLNGTALVDETNYWVYADKAYIRFFNGVLNSQAPQNVKVTYDWGYTTVPKAVEHFCTEVACRIFQRYKADFQLEGLTEARMSEYQIVDSETHWDYVTKDLMHQLQPFIKFKLVAIG